MGKFKQLDIMLQKTLCLKLNLTGDITHVNGVPAHELPVAKLLTVEDVPASQQNQFAVYLNWIDLKKRSIPPIKNKMFEDLDFENDNTKTKAIL